MTLYFSVRFVSRMQHFKIEGNTLFVYTPNRGWLVSQTFNDLDFFADEEGITITFYHGAENLPLELSTGFIYSTSFEK